MDSPTRILFGAALGLGLVVLAVVLQPTIENKLAPDPRIAWVAVEVAGRGVAEVGSLEIEAGTPFTLHAVVEAEGRGGRPVYYTEAAALTLDGESVPADRLRRWDRPLEARIRWFTVEGNPPYLELTASADLEGFSFRELYRPLWPLAWSVPGEIGRARDDHLRDDSSEPRGEFGTQRYHVTVELYDTIDKLRPKKRIRSWRAQDVRREGDRFPTVRRVLPGRLAAASRVFGLTQLEAAGGVESAELRQEIDDLARRGLAFSRATVLRDQIEAAGRRLEDVTWRYADLVKGASRWGATAQPGDLLRAGDRLVVFYQDRGEPGVLDREDLCFDFARGAAVRRLAEVFTGDGVVELAALGEDPP